MAARSDSPFPGSASIQIKQTDDKIYANVKNVNNTRLSYKMQSTMNDDTNCWRNERTLKQKTNPNWKRMLYYNVFVCQQMMLVENLQR